MGSKRILKSSLWFTDRSRFYCNFLLVLNLALMLFVVYNLNELANLHNKAIEEMDDEYTYMNNLALAAGTDKSSRHHNYTGVYHRYLKQYKNKKIKLLEIGLWKGYSAKFWEQYFPHAELHFMDMTDSAIEYNSTRSKYHFMDQSDYEKVKKFGERYGPFDIIIDDGGHANFHIIPSFKALFPQVNPGGMYIVEDLHTSYYKGFGGAQEYGKDEIFFSVNGSTIDYLWKLVDEVNYYGATSMLGARPDYTRFPAMRQKMSYYAQHIESIHFYNCLCIMTVW